MRVYRLMFCKIFDIGNVDVLDGAYFHPWLFTYDLKIICCHPLFFLDDGHDELLVVLSRVCRFWGSSCQIELYFRFSVWLIDFVNPMAYIRSFIALMRDSFSKICSAAQCDEIYYYSVSYSGSIYISTVKGESWVIFTYGIDISSLFFMLSEYFAIFRFKYTSDFVPGKVINILLN